MPIAIARPYLLCYDIGDPKRLQRVHRIALENGIQWQYSVYYHYINEHQAQWLLKQITQVIDEKADDVRLYPLPNKLDAIILGRNSLSEGIHLPGLPLPDGFIGD